MSGPLRRTKRSRPADAGEPLEEGLAAEPEGAATTPETPPAGDAGAAPVEPGEAASSERAAEAPSPKRPAARKPRATAAKKPAGAAKQPSVEASSSVGADEGASADIAGQKPPGETGATQPPGGSDTAATEPPAAAVAAGGAAEPSANEPAAEATGSEPTAEIPSPGATPPETPGDTVEETRRRRRWRPFRRHAKRTPATEATQPAAPAPVLLADPNTPAGLDPAEAPMRPPAGRRSRLRRRLRYLRRARELMLRDLGGLLYEVYRTGGGKVDAHATVVGAKVQRIAGLDAEAHALETALRAPRSETVVFEPGVGGTCETCGELYGSDARFCSNCGASIGTGAPAAPAPAERTESNAEEPARRGFWRRAARPTEEGQTSEDTAVMKPADESAASGEEPTAVVPPDETGDTEAAPPGEQPSPPRDDPPTPGAEAASQPPTEEPQSPLSGLRNGRPDDHTPPGLSSGDPLASRESRS